MSYVIHVGHHAPQKVLVATPDRETGVPTGNPIEVLKTVGVVNIINRARVWGRRVYPDGTIAKMGDVEVPVELNDPKYRGTIEFLKWGDNKTGAQAIEIRYLAQSSSLDYDWQTTVQRIQTRVEDGTDYLSLSPGQNKFDERSQALLIQMYKVHPQNRDSVSKNPDPMIKGYTYLEVNDENSDKTLIRHKEKALDAGVMVKKMSSKPEQLKSLLDVIMSSGSETENPVFSGVNELSIPNDIYTALLLYADAYPARIMAHVQGVKDRILDSIEYAKSFNALDTSKAGFVALNVNGSPRIIWSDLPVKKGGDGIDYVLENWADQEIYMGVKKLFASREELK